MLAQLSWGFFHADFKDRNIHIHLYHKEIIGIIILLSLLIMIWLVCVDFFLVLLRLQQIYIGLSTLKYG